MPGTMRGSWIRKTGPAWTQSKSPAARRGFDPLGPFYFALFSARLVVE
jgi:hypothetical protein